MKFHSFSNNLLLCLGICNLYKCLAKEVIREYHFNKILVNTFDGCHEEITNHNSTFKSYLLPAGKKIKHNKRQIANRVPLEDPIESSFICDEVDENQCNKLKEAVNRASKMLAEALDLYRPIIAKFEVRSDVREGTGAFTNIPTYYSLKDPEEQFIYTYPIALTKQLITDREIQFNTNVEFDTHIVVNKLILQDTFYPAPIIVHEMLHSMGFITNTAMIKNGNLEFEVPKYGNDYYMPGILKSEDQENGYKVIDGFFPISIYEKNFVEMENPNHYFFNEPFKSLSDVKDLGIVVHEPMYYDDRRNLYKVTEFVEKWTGMSEGEEFYKKAHEFHKVGFKTKSGIVIPVCTNINGEDPSLFHLGSRNDEDLGDGTMKKEYDENYVIYCGDREVQSPPEEKIKKYAKPDHVGDLSQEIIDVLSTLGYHRKNDPPSDKVYQVITELLHVDGKKIIDGGDEDDDDDDSKTESAAISSFSLNFSLLGTLCIIVLSTLL
ncbi:hypothetical protein H8356DRAFT_1007215 [Neocallimastix lanati (nom. inval.)]|jgi:hypothetical protein|nr:hypothetical protein H8356DRAFT_1007215 [Neocallimastix sp. JGI-2020a]